MVKIEPINAKGLKGIEDNLTTEARLTRLADCLDAMGSVLSQEARLGLTQSWLQLCFFTTTALSLLRQALHYPRLNSCLKQNDPKLKLLFFSVLVGRLGRTVLNSGAIGMIKVRQYYLLPIGPRPGGSHEKANSSCLSISNGERFSGAPTRICRGK